MRELGFYLKESNGYLVLSTDVACVENDESI